MLLLGGTLAASAYLLHRSPPSVAPRPEFTGDAAVVERFQCYRCHTAPDRLVPPVREASCVACHQAILAGEFEGTYLPEDLLRWQSHLTNLVLVPRLDALDQRVTRAWLVSFLEAPHDLRPHLPASMPRFRMTRSDAETIARHFIPVELGEVDAAPGDALAGRERYLAEGCAGCHAYSGSGIEGPPIAASDAIRLAPDLSITRERMPRSAALAWLADPERVRPDTLMPRPEATEAERADLVAFLFDAPLAEPTAEPPLARLPLLDRPVTHAEVDAAVFHRTCRHCHADPLPVGGDGGPGNTGGLGFEGSGFDLSTYEAIDRSRSELLRVDASGLPLLVGALVRRHEEVRGRPAERRGMPLALPPISLEALQLVETWVAQGAPRE